MSSEKQYVPWYLKRSCPIFCWPCVPVYTGIWPARKFLIVLGLVLFFIGIMLLLGLLLVCIAVSCSALAGALLPFALLFIILGILFLHCGWAAHLLDTEGHVPEESTSFTRRRVTRFADDEEASEEADPIFEEIRTQEQPEIKRGFWQFNESNSWQAVANPYPIQHTLKPVIERQAY